MKNKIAIVQNIIIWGGRLDLIIHVIKYLNERKIVPEIVTFQVPISFSEDEVFNYYGVRAKFKYKVIYRRLFRLLRLIRLPFEYNIFIFNLLINRYKNHYDLFFNISNTDVFMPNSPTISYVCFPRKSRALSKFNSIHSFNPVLKKKSGIKGLNNFFIKFIYKNNNKINSCTKIVCISEFTRIFFIDAYIQYSNSMIPIIYPPYSSNKSRIKREDKLNQIVHIGRFEPNKLQLQLIRFAKTLPDAKFKFIGFSENNNSYAIKCKKEIEKLKLNNVELYINASRDQLNQIIKESYIYISTTPNEPFGLGVLQAITDGNCLPLVPNTGGQCEIVPFNELQYNDFDSLKKKIIFNMNNDESEKLRIKLFKHVSLYSYNEFSIEMDKVVRSIIDVKK